MGIIQRKRRSRNYTTDPAPEGQKQCATCREVKDQTAFSRDNDASDGLSYQCRACRAEKDRAYRHRRKVASWERNYGTSEQVYWDLFEEQGGACAICKQPETWIHKGVLAYLSVDHDHITGRVRGLLCHRCNTVLGMMNDNCSWLRAMLEYLT